MEIVINVINQNLKLTTNSRNIIDGSQQFVAFRFQLDDSWDGLHPFAQFIQEDNAYNVYLDKDNKVFLPPEIKSGSFMLMLYGSGGTTKATTNFLTFTVDHYQLVGNAQSTQITKSLYDQLVEKVDNLMDTTSGDYKNLVVDIINRAIQSGDIEELAISDGSIARNKVNIGFESTLKKADSAMQPTVYDTNNVRQDIFQYTNNKIVEAVTNAVVPLPAPYGYTFVFKPSAPQNNTEAQTFAQNKQLWLNTKTLIYYSPQNSNGYKWNVGTKLVNNPTISSDYYVPEGAKWAYFKYIENEFLQIGNTSYSTEEIDNKVTRLQNSIATDIATQGSTISNIGNRVDNIDEMIQNKEIPTTEQLGIVTPDMFGAIGDGVNDDTEAMIECLEYANRMGYKVEWHGKTIYLKSAVETHCPVIDTDVDFSGCTILMTGENQGQTILKVGYDPEDITEEMTGKVINVDTANTVFENYPNSYIAVESLHFLGRRFNNPGTETWYRHKQGFVTNSYGAIQPLDLFREISEYKLVNRIDKMARPILCRFGKILITNGTAAAVILVQRANVTIQDVSVIPEIEEYTYINKTPFTIYRAYNVTLKNIVAINLPVNSDTTVTSYIIDVHLSYKVTLDNIVATKGWGAMATHWCTDIIIRGCHLGRADYHYGTYGLNVVENCDFISYPCKIELGYGDGTVIIRDCFFYKRMEGQIYASDFFQMRNDFAMMFSGKFIVQNCTLQIYDHSIQKYSWGVTYRTYGFDGLLDWAPKNFPYMYFDQLLIRSEAGLDNYDKFQLIGVSNRYVNDQIEVGQIHIACDSIDLQVRLITDFNNFDTENAVMTLKNCFLDATNYFGKIYKDGNSIISSASAKIYDLYCDHNEIDMLNVALEIFDDTTEDNLQVVEPVKVHQGNAMNLIKQQEYPLNGETNPAYAYSVYEIDGDYPYLVSGRSTSNAAGGNGSLCAYYDIEDNWIKSDGFTNGIRYENYRSIAPSNAVKMIVNLGSGADQGKTMSVTKILTKCASSRLNRMQSIIDDHNSLMPSLEPVPDILDIVPATVEQIEINANTYEEGSCWNLLINRKYTPAGDYNANYAYAIFPVTEGKIYRVTGKTSSNAEGGNGALCAFYAFDNSLIGEPFGREPQKRYDDFEITAPVGASTLIVNRTASSVTITVKETIYHGAYSTTIQNVVNSVEDLPIINNIMDIQRVDDQIVDVTGEVHNAVCYNLKLKGEWGQGNAAYGYSVFTDIVPGDTYYATGSTTSKADMDNGNGALGAFYDEGNNIIGEPFGRDNVTTYQNFEVVAPEGAVKLIVIRAKGNITVGLKHLIVTNPYSQTIQDILDRLTELEENGGGGGGGAMEIIELTVNPALVEIGSTVTTANISYRLNATPYSLALNGTTVEPLINGFVTLNNLSLTDDMTWTLEARTKKGLVITKDVTLEFVNNIYHGVAANPTTVNEAFVKQDLTKVLKGTKNIKFTETAGANQYIWFAVPVRYGECSFTVNGFSGGFELVQTISNFTNNSGYKESYRVYKSDNPNLGNTTVEVN